MAVATTVIEHLRRSAMQQPGVLELSHGRFHVPVWKVQGKTFLGITADQTAVVFVMDKEEAMRAEAELPGVCEVVHRTDAARSYLGLQVPLEALPKERVRPWVERAWRWKAPRRLVAERDRQTQAGS